MLHLFKKTYLDIDSNIDSNLDRIIISEKAGHPPYSKMEIFFHGNLLGHGLNLEEVVGEGKTFGSFVSMLETCFQHNSSTNKKVIIHCDKIAFMKFSSLWFKLILKNPTASGCFKILLGFFNKQTFITNAAYDKANDQENYESFDMNELEFTQIFNQTTLTDENKETFLNSIKSSLSLEYYMASYYYDGSFKNELKAMVKLMIHRFVKDLVKDIWTKIATNISNKSLRDKMGFNGTYNFINYSNALSDVRLNSLRSMGAHLPFYDDWSSIHTLPFISSLSEPQIEEIKDQIIKTTFYSINSVNLEGLEIISNLLKPKLDLYFKISRDETFSDQDFDIVINSVSLSNDIEKFWSHPDRKNINFFFIDELTQLKANNQQALLSEYVLK